MRLLSLGALLLRFENLFSQNALSYCTKSKAAMFLTRLPVWQDLLLCSVNHKMCVLVYMLCDGFVIINVLML